jgi:hypothetical protein
MIRRLTKYNGSINLYDLQTVDNDLIMRSCVGCSAKGSMAPENVAFVNFNYLRSVGYIEIAGVILLCVVIHPPR